jgi:hypothetical protein
MIVDVQVEIENPGDETSEDINRVVFLEMYLNDIADEYLNACDQFPNFRSSHEGLAIIQEEFLEFREVAFWPHKHPNTNAEHEVKQLAAMCVRYLMDITNAGL